MRITARVKGRHVVVGLRISPVAAILTTAVSLSSAIAGEPTSILANTGPAVGGAPTPIGMAVPTTRVLAATAISTTTVSAMAIIATGPVKSTEVARAPARQSP